MRHFFLIPVLFAFSACSTRIYMSSEYANVLQTGTPRKSVIAALGNPTSTSLASPDSGGSTRADTYFTTARIPDLSSAMGAGMAAEMTLGLSEIIFVPAALIEHNARRPKHLVITYDRAAKLDHYIVRAPSGR